MTRRLIATIIFGATFREFDPLGDLVYIFTFSLDILKNHENMALPD